MKFAELFCGIGGFRFGLEKANNGNTKAWREGLGNGEGKGDADLEGGWRGTQQTYDYCRSSEPFRKDSGTNRNLFNSSGSENEHGSAYHCVWANDVDKYACQIYRKHYGNRELVEGDIRTIDPNTIPDFDVLTGGFPCQSFSLAGKRRGFEDTRGTLFYEVARIACAKRPRILLLENVKGLLSNDNGETFAKIVQTLDELGYLCEWQVLNSKHFGVPQNRERVFIIGHLRGSGTGQIFPVGQTGESVAESCGKAQAEGSRIRSANSPSLRATYYKGYATRGPLVANSLNCSGSRKERNLIERKVRIHRDDEKKSEIQGYSFFPETADYVDIVDNHPKNILVANTLSHRYGKEGSENLVQIADFRNDEGLRIRKESICPNLTTRRHSETDISTMAPLILGQRIRRLTPTECERLQGFPDGWTEGVSDTQRYKLLGNAVTTNVITFLGSCLQRSIREKELVQ